MTTQTELAIMVNHEGDECAGFYQLYPANDESEPDFPFQDLFEYDRDFLPPVSQSEARAGAEREAQRIADRIGGQWLTTER
jgi:hypothetical protein